MWWPWRDGGLEQVYGAACRTPRITKHPIGFGVSGFRVLGFRVLGFGGLGFRVYIRIGKPHRGSWPKFPHLWRKALEFRK